MFTLGTNQMYTIVTLSNKDIHLINIKPTDYGAFKYYISRFCLNVDPPLHKQNKRMVRHPPSPYLAYVILERKCRSIVPQTRDCSAGKSIKSSLPQCLVTQLTSNFIIMGLRGQSGVQKVGPAVTGQITFGWTKKRFI